jgi:hypothetical protein
MKMLRAAVLDPIGISLSDELADMQCPSRREYQPNPGGRPKKTETLLNEALAKRYASRGLEWGPSRSGVAAAIPP